MSYLFDYNVRLVFYSIEISRKMYISNIVDYIPIDQSAFLASDPTRVIFLGKFAFPYLSSRIVGIETDLMLM